MHGARRVVIGLALSATVAAGTIVSAQGAAAASATRFTIGTHNTKHGTSSAITGFADVIGWQELDHTHKNAAQSKARGLKGYDEKIFAGPAVEDSISWRASKFTLVAAKAVYTHHGIKKISPNRYVTYVVLKVRATGKKFAFVNTHFISGTWSKNPKNADRRKYRTQWEKHYRIMRNVVAGLRAKHLPVFVVGDMNRLKSLSFPGLERYATNHVRGPLLDQMFATSANKVGDASRLSKYGSDHYAYRATVRV